jgi:osmotically-inducible protein OsmY
MLRPSERGARRMVDQSAGYQRCIAVSLSGLGHVEPLQAKRWRDIMSERDRQDDYNRDREYGSSRSGTGQNLGQGSGQAHQWQSEDYRQQGGDWQQDAGQRGGSDDYSRDYRFSGQGSRDGSRGSKQDLGRGGFQDYGQGSRQGYDRGSSQRAYGGSSGSQLNEDSLRNDQRDASRNYQEARGGYGPQHDRGGQDWQRDQGRSGQRGDTSGYAGRTYDASGGNDFGSFTSEDYGGRDFSNRGGGAMGGMRSSESYRPSYGLSAWLHGNDDNDGRVGRNERGAGFGQNSGREDYGSWRQYGESRGFLARAGDEVASWFGDEDASRRREQDHRQGRDQSQSHRGRGPSNYTRSDERIREDANDHLTHDHHVDASHINVSVKDGELTLDGTVDSRDAKRRAEDAVEHISGVKHVQNNLRVQDRSASGDTFGGSTTSSGGSSTGSTANQSSGSGLTGSGSSGITTGSGAGASGASTTASGSGSAATGQPSSASSQGASTTAASTTGGIGSSTTTGAGAAGAAGSATKTR